jgi:hypothetical protein
VKHMYKLLFRESGTESWNEGSTFSDEELTVEAREMLADRYARHGLETKWVRLEADGVMKDE